MRTLMVLFASLCFAISVHAATLLWDAQPTTGGSLMVERGTSPTGPFTTIATLPQGTTQFILTPGAWGHYRVRNSVGSSNTVAFSLDQYTGDVTVRLDTLELNYAALSSGTLTLQATDADLMAQDLGFASQLALANQELAALKARVAKLETVPTGIGAVETTTSTVNITARQVDSDHIEVVGTNCLSLRTTGSGLRRTVECVR